MFEEPRPEEVQKEQKPRGEIKEFLQLSPDDEEELRARVTANQGLVRIFVHPYYKRWRGNPLVRPPEDPPDERAKKEQLNQAIVRMAALPAERTPPLLFFEEEHSLDKFKSRFADGLMNILYIVPTQDTMPEPFIEPNEKFEKDPAVSERNWNTLKEKLRAYGVQKILIGGMYFKVQSAGSNQEDAPEQAFTQCVGVTINHLQDDFEIEVSNFTLPDGRKEYLEAKDRIGE